MTEKIRPIRPTITVPDENGAVAMDMADAIDAMARIAKAANPVTAAVIWETVEGESHKIHWRTAPSSWPLQKGMSEEWFDKLHPAAAEDAE